MNMLLPPRVKTHRKLHAMQLREHARIMIRMIRFILTYTKFSNRDNQPEELSCDNE
jgi:hypothetical protein